MTLIGIILFKIEEYVLITDNKLCHRYYVTLVKESVIDGYRTLADVPTSYNEGITYTTGQLEKTFIIYKLVCFEEKVELFNMIARSMSSSWLSSSCKIFNVAH